MGRTTVSSSSRRKHSKKKFSSEGYRKKKSRRNKSKKIRSHDDSFSSCSDDDELTTSSSSLDSSSSSEGGYRSKRARSRSRNETKGSKKRSRKRYASEDRSEDSHLVKKRKRSKKGKKIKKKKRSKRDVYYSSASSDSGSCSTCKDEGGSKGRIGNRKNMSETRSSISPSSSYDSEKVQKTTMENNPVRLKSVITVANLDKEKEDDSMKNDQLKEEIVYDYDDYPSSKSNDSVELVDRFDSSEKRSNAVKEVNSRSNLGDSKEKESNVSDNIGSEVEDLESVLRRKALENLSRFRDRLKAKPVVPVDDKTKNDQSDVKQLMHETVSTTPVSQPVTHRSRFTWRRDPSGKDEKAATYSESQPAELKLQKSTAAVNEASKSMDNTNNVDQKSTAVVETPSVKEGSSKEQRNENNDSSQFEKKTMSVMRGGEMVQVSYKVYIPNRAPALARRQLKR